MIDVALLHLNYFSIALFFTDMDCRAAVNAMGRDQFHRLLTDKRGELSKMTQWSAGFRALSDEIIYMFTLQREKMWGLNCFADTLVLDRIDFIDPSVCDVFFSDVNHELLMSEISDRLGVTYLSPAENLPKEWTLPNVSGILFGPNFRPVINLAISSKKYKKCINIIFLVDTGSPYLYICEQALEALGFTENIPKSLDVVYRDTLHIASISPKLTPDGRQDHFQDINLIGSDFLKTAFANLIVDYRNNEVTIEF